MTARAMSTFRRQPPLRGVVSPVRAAGGPGGPTGAPRGGGGTVTSASGVVTAAVSWTGLPQLGQNLFSSPSAAPQFVQYLWATALLLSR